MEMFKILVVDDQPMNRLVISRILSKDQIYEVLEAENGLQCLEMSRFHKPDLILLDIMMPGMSGFETLREMKKEENLSSVPVIFLSAMSEEGDKVEGLESGAVDYLTKPVQKGELRARLKTHLTISRLQRSLESARDEYKGLVHVICHDMRNYLNSIRGFAELSRMFDDHEKWRNYLNKIFDSSGRAVDFLENIKQFEAASEKKFSLNLVCHNLSAMLRETENVFENRFLEKNLIFDLGGIDPDVMIRVDRNWFVLSVLNNIVSNAIKFSFENSKILVSSRQLSDCVELHIRDFGVGISKERIEGLFDSRTCRSTKGTKGEVGTGFGMPLVSKWVRIFGGEIRVESILQSENEEDHGTTFILSFPNCHDGCCA